MTDLPASPTLLALVQLLTANYQRDLRDIITQARREAGFTDDYALDLTARCWRVKERNPSS